MVGFPSKQAKTVVEALAVEVIDQDPKVKTFTDTLDFPSIDSFLDFGSVNWLESNLNTEEFNIEDTDFDFFEGMDQEGVIETHPENQTTIISEPMIGLEPTLSDNMSENIDGVPEPAVKVSEPVVSDNSKAMEAETAVVASPTMNLDESEVMKTDEGLASSIEVGLEKVSLTMDDDDKHDGPKEKTDSDSESEASSSSSGSSDSSSSEEEDSDEEASDDDENKKENMFEDQMAIVKEDDVAVELEEGEIESVDEEHKDEVEDDEDAEDDDDDDDDDDDEANEMVAWSNDEDEDLGLQTKEPIRSKNELKELPPVPSVDVTLEPHHVTCPVGVVLSVMSTQVIVEGMEQHSPLTEGSILWITEKRTPLGLVDEIFGPVKCPYYIVRFNSESEVPEGVGQGTPVSFVVDFAQHILNIKELQKKGYDASGDNDEEIPDELEFSDDEKEAEYRRMQKMEKRGMMNDDKTGNKRNKKKKNRDLGRPTSSYSAEWTENQGPSSLSSNRSDPQMGGPVSNSHPRPQVNGFAPNGADWRPQGNQQNQYQLPPIPNQMGMPNLSQMQIPLMAMQNQMMFQPQFNGGHMPMQGGPGGLNLFPGQASAPWPAFVGQNCFNQQPFGMGRGIQQQLLPNELNFNMFASQGFQMHQPQSQMNRPQSQMHRPPSPMNPQFQMQPQFQTHPQSPMNPQFQMMHPQQSPINPQIQMQPQSEMRPQSQIPHSPTNSQSQMQPQSQGFSRGQSSERGRGHRGRGRGRGRGRFGRGQGRGQQQS